MNNRKSLSLNGTGPHSGAPITESEALLLEIGKLEAEFCCWADMAMNWRSRGSRKWMLWRKMTDSNDRLLSKQRELAALSTVRVVDSNSKLPSGPGCADAAVGGGLLWLKGVRDRSASGGSAPDPSTAQPAVRRSTDRPLTQD